MITLDNIRPVIGKELDEFEIRFREAMKSSVPLLDKITYYLIKRRGKQLRPMLVLFSAGINGKITESTYYAASLVELLHTATLVHDDVVDDAYRRRGVFSINALWKNKIAVLVGDYLLSRGLLLGLENKEHRLLEIVSRAVRKMSEGELLQIEKTRRLDLNEEVYLQIISGKTGSLVAACCASGAASAGAPDNIIERMREMGEKIGIAFQIKDDLLDYGTGSNTGKTSGADLKDKKLSLPLIHSLSKSSSSERRRIINLVKNYEGSAKDAREILDFVKVKGGIDYANSCMKELTTAAKLLLADFPPSPYLTAFHQLIEFVTERDN
jgi:octaprenyl-diphosphate synthase